MPTLTDRMIRQQVLHQVISALFEPEFPESGVGIRADQDTHQDDQAAYCSRIRLCESAQSDTVAVDARCAGLGT